ncbi:hypothetical protein [Serratia liquefaciens]|jgi:hypothetical protein|uniref:hypothetical protein n=1 Tax=Serratia liquefaciens TaxID=614 RepID=UPI00370D20B4
MRQKASAGADPVFLKAAGANDGRALPVTVYFTGKTAAQSEQVLPDHRVGV